VAVKSIITYIIVGALFLSVPHLAYAQGDCAPPALEPFLEASRAVLHFTGTFFPSPEAETLCITMDGQRHKWLGVRWYGPEDGALFVLGATDARIATLPLGAVRNLRVGPRLLGSETETVWVDYLASHGTGYLLLKTALMTLSGGNIVTLWSHTIFERNFVLPSEEGTEEEYTVTENEDGSITVSGILKTFSPQSKLDTKMSPQNIKNLEKETFCWIEIIGGYARCRAK
jgi:hypothetical protein